MRKSKKQKTEPIEEVVGGREELVSLENIELIHGRKKTDKETRIEALKKGEEYYSGVCKGSEYKSKLTTTKTSTNHIIFDHLIENE